MFCFSCEFIPVDKSSQTHSPFSFLTWYWWKQFLVPNGIHPPNWRGFKPDRGENWPPLVFPQPVMGYTILALRGHCCWQSWQRFCGGCMGVPQVWCTHSHPYWWSVVYFYVFSYRGPAWDQSLVIECNWAKLPLIRWMEKWPVPQKGTSLFLFFKQNTPPSSPFLLLWPSKISPRWRLSCGD